MRYAKSKAPSSVRAGFRRGWATVTPSASGPPGVRRQWGSEKPRPPLPAVEKPAGNVRTWMGGVAIGATVLAWFVYMARTIVTGLADNDIHPMPAVRQTVFYVVLMSLLTFSALMYLAARQGAMYRSRTHVRVPRADLDRHFADVSPSITVLVPSYAEEPAVVRSTLISAALQEFPNVRIVLLIDDPPLPKDEHARATLEACRALPQQIMNWLAEPARYFTGPTVDRRGDAPPPDVLMVASQYDWAAGWLRYQERTYPRESTTDDFMASEVFGALAGDFEATASALRMAVSEGATVKKNRLYQLQQRLQRTFHAEVTSFERKKYISLSHEANKAMNLNAYLGLMGRSFAIDDTPKGVILTEVRRDPDMVVPDSEYILTLDADSVLLRDYCLRLVYQMEEPGSERLAVIQTPYSAFRGARTRVERMAGATTDIQHLVHQGLTYFNATFWVGANAVIRKAALADIEEISYEDWTRGPPVHSGPHCDRGHRVQHRPGRQGLDPAQLRRTTLLQRHTGRLRLACRAACPVGKRRAADHPKVLAARAQPEEGGSQGPVG